MPIIATTATTWLNSEAVGAIESTTDIRPSDDIRSPNERAMLRVTKFKSFQGTELLVLVGKVGFSTDPQDSNVELKAMHYVHDEAIRAAREGRDFVPYSHAAR